MFLGLVLLVWLELIGSVRDVRQGRFLAGRLDDVEDPFSFDDEAIERGRWVGVGGTSSTRTKHQI